MSASQRILSSLSLTLPFRSSSSSSSSSLLKLRASFLFLLSSPSYVTLARSFSFSSSFSTSYSSSRVIPRRMGKGVDEEQNWVEKPELRGLSLGVEGSSASVVEDVTKKLDGLSVGEISTEQVSVPGQNTILKPRSYGTVSGPTAVEVRETPVDKTAVLNQGKGGGQALAAQKSSVDLIKYLSGNLLEGFAVDNSTYAQAQIRATFYPKFENEKSDQEVRTRMIEMVSNGLATLEVSLKHSGSLFMYAGHEGGAYAKNSFGNIYTAVGVFVLGRMFREAWGAEAAKKQTEFNEFLERNRMCISMELVTAVLGDHGQRPREDYALVTAVTELGNGKPRFYSTPDIIAFCRKWRLPTNQVWLFSTRKSVTSFFAAYDALCEEGTATPVCKALDEVADISVPGSKDHVMVQGEILEGLVARVVSHESSKHLEKVLKEFPPTPIDGASLDLGPSLRDICAENRSDEKQQMKALLQNIGKSFCPDHSDWLGYEGGDAHSRNADRSVVSKFLQCHPSDFSTTKVQEMVRLMRERRFPAAFKCYHNFHKVDSVSNDNLFYKMVVHVHSDSAFRRYQKEMRNKPGLWPLYRGFFLDINLFKANKEKATELAKNSIGITENVSIGSSTKDGLADEDANMMIKMKFLTYKLRTFLIRNGLSILFKEGPASYKAYYLRQMKSWGTSSGKQKELTKMLDEWAVYIKRKYGNKQLSSSTYLSEAEPFLEQYAKRSPLNQILIGAAGNLVRTEDFLAIIEGGRDEEGDLETERDATPASPGSTVKESVPRDEGLIVFFPGIPGCAKSALCKELLNAPGGFGDDRPVQSLMGDLIKGKYWQKVADERRRKPYSIMLADKNAPNEEVWRQIEDMCRTTRASAVPVVSDSEGTPSNPFSLDALAVFIYRVLQRVNHPGNLDKASPNAGYVLLMFYHLYEGKSRSDFDSELVERFGSLIKMPLLKSDRSPLPDPVKSILEEGISLYNLHTSRHGRLESTKGTYTHEWNKWEKKLREVLFTNAEYINSIQVPFEFAVKEVLEQLRKIAKGEYRTPDTGKRKFGTIVYAAITLPVTEIKTLLHTLMKTNPGAEAVLRGEYFKNLIKAHITLAHKRSHSVAAVANYGVFLHKQVPVMLTALLFTGKMAAFEADPGSVDGERVVSKNEWPHVTVWTAEGVAPKEANRLPEMLAEGKATCIHINPPVTILGTLEFF